MVVGTPGVAAMLFLTSIIGGVIAGTALLLRIRTRKDTMAFTPVLLLATSIYVAYSVSLLPR
jgi:hypothetical protein